MKDVGDWGFVFNTSCTFMSVILVVHTLYVKLWKPYSRRRFYEKQGIKGPVFRPFIGNLPEVRILKANVPETCGLSEPVARRVGLELFEFTEKYGKVTIYEQGSTTRIIVANPKLAREVLVAKSAQYHKAALNKKSVNIVAGGDSILLTEEDQWKEQHRIMNLAFRHNFLAEQFHHILESANELVGKWQTMIDTSNDKYGVEVAIDLDLPNTLLDIVIKTTFGSTTVKGGDIYAIHNVIKFMFKTLGPRSSGYVGFFPGYYFLPIPSNIKMWIEKHKMKKILMNIVRARLKQVRELKKKNPKAMRQTIYGTDLLGMLLEAQEDGNSNMNESELLSQCTTMLIASTNPTTRFMIWILFFMAMHPDWQERLRSEVKDVVGESTPQPDTLSRFKLMDMVLNETLRLMPSFRSVNRDAINDHQIGSMKIIKGTAVMIPIVVLHQAKDVWGEDAHLFNPERWDVKNHLNDKSDGSHFNSFIPFGAGNRICLGRNLVRMKAKLILSSLLQHFTFSLAPGYRHSPGRDLKFWPKFGVQLLINNVST